MLPDRRDVDNLRFFRIERKTIAIKPEPDISKAALKQRNARYFVGS
jgi:hypothetical protein